MSNGAAGLGAFGFWIFLAAIVVAGIWYDVRKKESQQETLRRVVESGRDIDPEVLDRILGEAGDKSTGRDLKATAMIVLCAAPGMAVLAFFLGQVATAARSALLGTAGLVGFVGLGLFLAAKLIERRNSNPDE